MTDSATSAKMDDASFGSYVEYSFKKGWQIFKSKWMPFYGLFLVMAIATGVPQEVVKQMNPESLGAMAIVLAIVLWVWKMVFSLGWTKITAKLGRNEDVHLSDYADSLSLLPQFLLGMVCLGVLLFVGFLLFIIPGIYLALKYMYVPFLIADKKMGAMDAFKKSAQMTNGKKWDLLVFGFVALGVNLVGLLLLGFGLLITLPVTIIAQGVLFNALYDRKTVEVGEVVKE